MSESRAKLDVMMSQIQKPSIAYRAAAKAIEEILAERGRQDGKWGQQNHDAGIWALILLEEIGEWAQTELHNKFGGPASGRQNDELIQVAAVAMAMLECNYRKEIIESEGK